MAWCGLHIIRGNVIRKNKPVSTNTMIIKTDKTFRESLKNIKLQDIVYPAIILVFIGVVFVIFLFATKFISKNINKIFYSESTNRAEALNIERYKLTAKKLGIVVTLPKEGDVTAVVTAPVVDTTTTTLDKKAITIIVKNSTKKTGVAGTLATSIENSGFNKPKTGNISQLYATTTVVLNEGKKAYEGLLLSVVRKSYPDAIATTTLNTGSTDVIVIIGVK